MLEQVRGLGWLRGGLFVALGLALAMPTAGCSKKKTDDSEEDDSKSKKKKKDDDEEKASKKDDDDEDSKSKKKKTSDDDEDEKPAKKVKAPKSVDDDDDDDEDDDEDAPKKKISGKKLVSGDVDLAGTFSVVGKNQDGKKYTGTATVTHLTGGMYKMNWKLGSDNLQGIAFKDGNVLSCGWAPKKDLGVMAYLVKPSKLEGVWFEEQDTKYVGFEDIVLKAGGSLKSNLVGAYRIAKGEIPGPTPRKTYGGTVDISVTKSGVYKLTWKFGSKVLKGLGLRSGKFAGSNTDVLSAGFNDAGSGSVLQYLIYENGDLLVGHWATNSSDGGDPTWGKETMEKK